MDERQKLALQRGAPGDIAIPEPGADLHGLAGQNVRQNGNDTAAAHGEDGDDLIVVAGVDAERITRERSRGHDAGNVAVGLLDASNHRVLRELLIGGGLDVDARAGRDVIDDDGLRRGVGDGGVHLDKAVLRGLVVVRGHDEHGVAADLAGVLCQADGVGRVVGAGAGDDGDAACRALCAVAQDLAVLFVGQRGAFAGGACDDEGVHALIDLPVDETAERRIVDAFSGQRGDEGGCNAAEDGIGSHNAVSFVIIHHLLQSEDKKRGICKVHLPRPSSGILPVFR